jgi:hypothetical protein
LPETLSGRAIKGNIMKGEAVYKRIFKEIIQGLSPMTPGESP